MQSRGWIFILMGVVFLLLAAGKPAPAQALRCGTSVISEGDTEYRVLKACGEPTYILEREEERIQRDFRPPADRVDDDRGNRIPFLVKENVHIEEWFYDLGSQRLDRKLVFENGVLVKIRTGRDIY